MPFSSGTGGLPKGVRLTHGNLAAAAAQAVSAFRSGGAYDEHSVVLAGAPFFHSMGLALMLSAPLSLGATIVTTPVPRVEPLLELIARIASRTSLCRLRPSKRSRAIPRSMAATPRASGCS